MQTGAAARDVPHLIDSLENAKSPHVFGTLAPARHQGILRTHSRAQKKTPALFDAVPPADGQILRVLCL
jgi:hypothetical protein